MFITRTLSESQPKYNDLLKQYDQIQKDYNNKTITQDQYIDKIKTVINDPIWQNIGKYSTAENYRQYLMRNPETSGIKKFISGGIWGAEDIGSYSIPGYGAAKIFTGGASGIGELGLGIEQRDIGKIASASLQVGMSALAAKQFLGGGISSMIPSKTVETTVGTSPYYLQFGKDVALPTAAIGIPSYIGAAIEFKKPEQSLLSASTWLNPGAIGYGLGAGAVVGIPAGYKYLEETKVFRQTAPKQIFDKDWETSGVKERPVSQSTESQKFGHTTYEGAGYRIEGFDRDTSATSLSRQSIEGTMPVGVKRYQEIFQDITKALGIEYTPKYTTILPTEGFTPIGYGFGAKQVLEVTPEKAKENFGILINDLMTQKGYDYNQAVELLRVVVPKDLIIKYETVQDFKITVSDEQLSKKEEAARAKQIIQTLAKSTGKSITDIQKEFDNLPYSEVYEALKLPANKEVLKSIAAVKEYSIYDEIPLQVAGPKTPDKEMIGLRSEVKIPGEPIETAKLVSPGGGEVRWKTPGELLLTSGTTPYDFIQGKLGPGEIKYTNPQGDIITGLVSWKDSDMSKSLLSPDVNKYKKVELIFLNQ